MRRLARLLTFAFTALASLPAQPASYALKFHSEAGVIRIDFSTSLGDARVWLPDDLAPGDVISGTVDAGSAFLLEFAGETAQSRAGSFRFDVPLDASAAEVPLILRNRRGEEVARASVPLRAKAAPPARHRVPPLVQAGQIFAAPGPYDGDLRNTSLIVGGKSMPVIAESPRKAVYRAPDDLVGPAHWTLAQGSAASSSGDLRALSIALTASAQPGVQRPAYDLSIGGLAGISTDVPLRIADSFFYLSPAVVPPGGTFTLRREFAGVSAEAPSEAARLIIPQTPEEEIRVILRTPRSDAKKDAATEHADAIRRLDFDAIPVLTGLLTDSDLGSDAAYAMLALNDPRVQSVLFASMPASGINIERLGLTWFLDHYDYAHGSANAADAHAAALRLLQGKSNPGTVIVELALYVTGLTGSPNDLPLVESFYERRAGTGWLQGVRDASEAASTRLRSDAHIESIRAELAPLPQKATFRDGLRLIASLEKAGFSGRSELAPQVCAHITDPVLTEIDISTNPGQHAITALSAIVDRTNPRMASASHRTQADWVSFCQSSLQAPLR